ncbi:tRNA N6-adenosine threonylcarbamoyltransferase [Elysia marginata]|uniref:N(6)-L-threonylcarbamoyladenine synthase n=1 Tax=Elysia marginata TaxID=1093978 RepID=A0AAV4G9D3_9GAST|nr:tRNA N6-adenosine threonylcarbamoyltransferase [Elysia marginata]
MVINLGWTYSKLRIIAHLRLQKYASLMAKRQPHSPSIGYLKNTLIHRYFTHASNIDRSKKTVLGIETSCDDTGAAIVDSDGRIIGEALHSQTPTHNLTGGIIPNVAKELHTKNVENVVKETLDSAQMRLQDVDALAVTVKPGLIMSLRVGLHYAQKLARSSGLPLIPIHHMEAHALTARMIQKIDFPFLVLLASGGHCLLAVAKDIDDFELLGSSLDTAPGEAYDKTARELNLFQQPEFSGLSGGAAVEQLARAGNPHAFPRVHVMSTVASCNFSFTGLKISAKRQIHAEYERLGVRSGADIDDQGFPSLSSVCRKSVGICQFELRQALVRCVDEARQTVPESLWLSTASASSFHFPVQH